MIASWTGERSTIRDAFVCLHAARGNRARERDVANPIGLVGGDRERRRRSDAEKRVNVCPRRPTEAFLAGDERDDSLRRLELCSTY